MNYYVTVSTKYNDQCKKAGMFFDFKKEKDARKHIHALVNGRKTLWEMFCFNVYDDAIQDFFPDWEVPDENYYLDCTLIAVLFHDGPSGSHQIKDAVYTIKYKINCNNQVIFADDWEEEAIGSDAIDSLKV